MPEGKVKKATPAKVKGNSKTLRLVAIILWVLAIGAEVFAIHLFNINIYDWRLIAVLVLDAILVIVGAQLWKRANRINPSKTKSKFVKFIWDQMGVIAAFLAFIPFGILLIAKADKVPKKTKQILIIITALLFAGTVGASADYNPTSPEDAEVKVYEDIAEGTEIPDNVFWTTYGKSYHFREDCHTLGRTTEANLHTGSIEDAFSEKRNDPCDFCVPQPEKADKYRYEEFGQEDDEEAPAA